MTVINIFAGVFLYIMFNLHFFFFLIYFIGWDLSSVDDIECLGITHGIVGVISLPGLFDPHLIIIKEATPVGVLYPPHLVYKIKSICILSSDDPDSILTACPRHNNSRY